MLAGVHHGAVHMEMRDRKMFFVIACMNVDAEQMPEHTGLTRVTEEAPESHSGKYDIRQFFFDAITTNYITVKVTFCLGVVPMGILLHYSYRCNPPGLEIVIMLPEWYMLHRPSTCCGVAMRASCAIGTRLAVAKTISSARHRA